MAIRTIEEQDRFDEWWKTYSANSVSLYANWNTQAETAARDAWEAAVQQEREECATICDVNASLWNKDPILQPMADGAADCGTEIRERN